MTDLNLDRLDMQRTALHEAGHGCAALRLGCPLRSLTIVPDDKAYGRARFASKTNRYGTEGAIIVRLMGNLSEGTTPFAERHKGAAVVEWPPTYDEALQLDIEDGLGDAMRRCNLSRERYAELVNIAYDMAEDPSFKREVAHVAKALVRHGFLTGAQVAELMRTVPEPRYVPLAEARMRLQEAEAGL